MRKKRSDIGTSLSFLERARIQYKYLLNKGKPKDYALKIASLNFGIDQTTIQEYENSIRVGLGK